MSTFHATKNFILRQSLKSQALVNVKILKNPMHPLHAQIRAKFNDPTLEHKLVLNFTASKKVSKKAVVRNHARRRTRVAVLQALQERGYGREGEPLVGGGREKGVTGSLTWFPTFECVTAAWGELKAEVGVAVDRWLEFRERELARGGGKKGGGGKKEKGGGGGGGGGGQGRGGGSWREEERMGVGRGLSGERGLRWGGKGPGRGKFGGERDESDRRPALVRRVGN